MLTAERTNRSRIARKRRRCRKVAYVVSRFPKLTETFVLCEILELERLGVEVAVFPLMRARNSGVYSEASGLLKKLWELLQRPSPKATMHAEVQTLSSRVWYSPLLSFRILQAQLFFLCRKPAEYFRVLAAVLRSTWGSSNYFLGALVFFPKAVYLAQQLMREEVEHVHAHFANHATTVAYIIHRLTGLPYSFTAHGSDFQVDQHMLAEKVKNAASVITVSDHNRDFILEYCGREHSERVHVVRCGVDTKVFQPASQKQVHSRDQQLHIVCTGTMYELKGHTYLIEACRKLRERGVQMHCHLVGDGPLRTKLQEQVDRSELSGHVTFYGGQTRDSVANLLSKADILVAPSVPTQDGRREGIPVVLMEAMAVGLPVVASRISGIPELVEHEETGLLVAPADAEGLADAMERLATNGEFRKSLGSRARQRILSDFNLSKNTLKLWAHFGGGAD